MRANQLIIRPFAAEDQLAARALILAGLGEHFGWIDERRNGDLDDIAANYAPPCHTFLVAESAGELVGTGALRHTDEHVGEMVRVSVWCDGRARRQACWSVLLVMRLKACAREQGLGRVVVETNNDWYDAIALYRRCGFVQYAEDDESVYLALDVEA